MGFRPHYLPDIVISVACLLCAFVLWRWAGGLKSRNRYCARIGIAVVSMVIMLGAMLAPARINRRLPNTFVAYARFAGLAAAVGMLYAFPLIAAGRRYGAFDPARRKALKLGTAAAVAAPATLGTFAFITRDDLQYREIDVPLPAHAKALDGMRIVQLTDIHMGPFVGERLVRRAVGMANDTGSDLAFVTGDFISTKGDPLESCLNIISGLRTPGGIFGCNGNHEIYAEAEHFVTEHGARLGIRMLRNESVPLQVRGMPLNLVGVDYQRRGSRYLAGVEGLLIPDAYNLLLSHNPDLFPVAAEKGFDLTVSGHTHGGQVTLETIHPSLNVVRFTTPYVHGLYSYGDSRLYVSRGIGTIGVPARLGAPPEVVCLRLCATSS